MNRIFKGVLLGTFVLSLGACAGITAPERGEIEPRGQPVVVALLENAEEEAAGGRLDQAANALERALRIEPQNAYLWHRLAGIRLEQTRAQDVISLASRSMTLTSDERLIAANWRLISQAHELTGDADKAREARRQAEKFE